MTVMTRAKRPVKTGANWWEALTGTLVTLALLAIPMYVIRPFRPQIAWQLAVALAVRGLAPMLSAVCALVVLRAAAGGWDRARGRARLWQRGILGVLTLVTFVGVVLAQVNIFEIMFHPYPNPEYGSAASVKVDADDKVLSVTIDGATRAYPIRTMGYHHIVNDTVGGQPIAVTYCTLCHTGLVWSRVMDGRTLYFRLAGINNGNALLRDEQTSSIWQQSTGIAIFGPLKGRQLGLVHSDELTFSQWRGEHPEGLVLKPEAKFAAHYEDKDWEQEAEKTRTVVDTAKTGIGPHELMLGVTAGGESKAYPVKAILATRLIEDEVGGVPVLLVVGPDKASIRVFKARTAEAGMTFLLTAEGSAVAGSVMQDAETKSDWSFEGCAIAGKLAGVCLAPVDANKDYWFDWMNHHRGTRVFKS
jgi:hypothetical protein